MLEIFAPARAERVARRIVQTADDMRGLRSGILVGLSLGQTEAKPWQRAVLLLLLAGMLEFFARSRGTYGLLLLSLMWGDYLCSSISHSSRRRRVESCEFAQGRTLCMAEIRTPPPWLDSTRDDPERARIAALSPEERLEIFAELCAVAEAMLAGRSDRREVLRAGAPLSPRAERQWRELIERARNG